MLNTTICNIFVTIHLRA